MNNKKVPRRGTSAIFLAIVLLAGTFAAISPSSIIKGVNAQTGPEYYDGKDNRYNSYEPDYGMNNDRKSYGNDNSYESQYQSYKPDYKPAYPSYGKDDRDKSKDSRKSVALNKVDCINNNVNINGNNTGDINVGNKGTAEGYLGGYSSYGSGGYGDGDGYGKQGKGLACIINNNNNNTNVVSGGGNVTDGSGNVNTCDENVRACFDALLNDEELQDLEDAFPFSITIQQPVPQPSITITIQSLDDFCEALQETLGAQNISILTTVVDEILQQAAIVITQAELQGLIRCIAEALGIETSIRLVESADSDSSTISLDNNIDNIDFVTNIGTSAFDINTAGGLTHSFSSPPTTAQGAEEDLSALEKIEKLKQQ